MNISNQFKASCITLETAEKWQLFAIAIDLADALYRDRLFNDEKYALIALNGDMGSGKSIFHDAVLSQIDVDHAEGTQGYSERWRGKYCQSQIDLVFLNATHDSVTAECALGQPRSGGMTFVQNLAPDQFADIGYKPDIWISVVVKDKAEPEGLRFLSQGWARKLAIQIENPDFAEGKSLCQLLEKLRKDQIVTKPDNAIHERIKIKRECMFQGVEAPRLGS